jgi:predicted amidohydrolase
VFVNRDTHADRVYGAVSISSSVHGATLAAARPLNIVTASIARRRSGAASENDLRQLVESARHYLPDLLVFPQDFPKIGGAQLNPTIIDSLGKIIAEAATNAVVTVHDRRGRGIAVVSLVYNRQGHLVGSYLKTHRLPGEPVILGNVLPVFDLDVGRIAIRIGTDAYFPEIDRAYNRQGARVIIWPTATFPIEDEAFWEITQRGRAVDNDAFIAIARYSDDSARTTNFRRYGSTSPPSGGSGVIDPHGSRLSSTGFDAGMLSVATVSSSKLKAVPASSEFRAGRRIRFSGVGLTDVNVDSPPQWTERRTAVISAIHQDLGSTPSRGFARTLEDLRKAGARRSDLAVMYEFSDRIDGVLPELARIASTYRMYVLIAGPINEQRDIEALLIGRDGRIAGRYRKLTGHSGATTVPVFDLDFARLGIRICADKYFPEIDQYFDLANVDIVANPDQSWGEGSTELTARDLGRSADHGFVYVRATHSSEEVGQLSRVVSRYGEILAQSSHVGGVVTAYVDLNDRPMTYAWDRNDPFYAAKRAFIRSLRARPAPDWQDTRIPATLGTQRDMVLRSRRPELYRKSTN